VGARGGGHGRNRRRPATILRRITRLFGRVTRDELALIDQGLEPFLGLT
jgi:hypothetical protein